MSYEIRYSDLVSVRSKIVAYVNEIEAQLAELQKSYNALLQSGSMTGTSADTLNTYIYNVHENLLSIVSSMLKEYLEKILVYENGLHELEGNRDAIIFEEELRVLNGALGRAKRKYVGITGEVSSTLSSVSDIYHHSEPDTNAVETAYDKTAKIASDFQTAVGRYEHSHRNDCSQVEEYISKINQILSSQLNNQNATISIESIKEVVNSQPFQDLYKMQEATNQFGENNKLAIGKEYNLMNTEAEEEAARQRELNGILKIATGAVAIIAVVGTGGAATPLVVAFEMGAVSYGVAETMEGAQDVYYGAMGDAKSFAFNPLRDGIMQPVLAPVIGQENVQTAYEIYGLVTTIGCGGAAQLSKQGIEVTAKSFGEAYAKEGIKQLASVGAGYGAGQIADQFGVDDGGRQLISLAAGLSVSYGLGKVNALKVKPVGPDPNLSILAERDVHLNNLEEGIKSDYVYDMYKDYLKANGITEKSLTTAEIQSIKEDITNNLSPAKLDLIHDNAMELLKKSDARLADASAAGYKAKDYYNIVNNSGRTAKEYMDTLKGTTLKSDWAKEFYGGGSKTAVSYMPKDAYRDFVLKGKTIGRPDGQFVLPKGTSVAIEEKLAKLGSMDHMTDAFKIKLAEELGLPQNAFDAGVVRVEIPITSETNLHMVQGIESGCNYQWVPGTKTISGTREGIMNQITLYKNPAIYNWVIDNAKGY